MKHPRPSLLAAFLLVAAYLPAHAAFESFEGDGFGEWQAEGQAFGLSPVHGKLDGMKSSFGAYANEAFALSAHGGDDATGTLTSPEFTIREPYIAFLIAGGDTAGKTAFQLLIDGKAVMEATGSRSMRFGSGQFDVSALKGKRARLRIVDGAKGEWGFIAVDEIVFSSYANTKFPVSTRNGKPFIEGLVASHVIEGTTIPDGSTLNIEASYGDGKVMSPTALTFDEQGNVYIAETHRFRRGIEDDRNHLYWYLDDLQARKTEDRRALHKKWEKKLSHAYMTKESEVIRRLSDTDGDGTLDESKVFSDGYNDVLDGTAAGVFFYDGCLYFACIPKIYKLRDTDGDGVADEKKVVQDGFGVRISLSGHDLNGFTLGPDGRIYGTMGDRGYSLITKEGKEYNYPDEGAVFRFEPDGSGFEIVHTGLRNPKEIAFDELGNAITVDNNSDQGDRARVVYIVEGGDSGWQMEHQAMHTFHRQIGLEKRPPSRWMDERMWELRNDSQPAYMLPPSDYLTAGPSGLTYHPGAGFLESEKGRFLICDYKGGAASSGIWSFAVEPDGGGMKMTDARQFNWGVAATDVEYSFDGRVFITDFVTGWQTHEDGRLLSLNAGENMYLPAETEHAAELIREGFGQRSEGELARLLAHPDSRVRLRAQVALTRKDGATMVFKAAAASENRIERVHGIWGLGILARRGAAPSATDDFSSLPKKGLREEAAKAIIPFLTDPDPEIRVQALRVIGEAGIPGDSLPLGKLLSDDSMRVRFAAGIAIGKTKAIGHYSAVIDFLRKNNNRDVYLRHAGIYALEHMATNPRQISIFTGESSPALRLAAVVALRRMNSTELARFINDTDPKVQDEVIRAIHEKDMTDMRPLAAALLDTLDTREWAPFMLRRLIHNAYRIGTTENAARIIRVAANPDLPEEVRMESLRLLANWEKPFPVDQLTGHWRPLDPRPRESIVSPLEDALPGLLKGDAIALTGALEFIGQYRIDIASLDSGSLRAIAANSELPDKARTMAMELYSRRMPADLKDFLVKLAGDSSDATAIAALSHLSEIAPDAAIPLIEAAVSTGSAWRAQQAWPIIAGIPGEETAAFIAKNLGSLREADGISPSAIELLAAAATRKDPAVTTALSAFEKAIESSDDPLAKYNVSLKGGDVAKGALPFASHPGGQCMRCHKAEESGHSGGGDAGPNLSGIGGLHDRRYLLEAIVNPGAVVAPGYGITSVTFKNGASLGGNLVAETPEYLDISTPEKTLRAKRSDIASFTPPVSAMPPMALLLQPSETRDLVAWLASLKKSRKQPAIQEPETVDPAKLPGARN
ncbi:HEAT repeat domain-containing protein [Akkermansiaceae bacterium]|nr:HEAT repeat domain-containing protein [Akkermansiaceae bacterium]